MRIVVIVMMCFAANAACNSNSAGEFLKASGLFLVLVITSMILQYTVSGFRHSCPPAEVKVKGRVKVVKKKKCHNDFIDKPESWGGQEPDGFFNDLD